jgi:DNA-binding transcriptional LysR family regulator
MRQVTDFDLRLLRVFVTIVECGGMTAAQARLNLAPSTLSEYVKDLELRAGFSVCLRGRRGFRLTDKGRQLYNAAREMLIAVEAFRSKASELGDRLHGALRIGMLDSMSTATGLSVAGVIRRFRRRATDVHLTMIVAPPPELETALIEDQIDVAVGPFAQPRPGLEYTTLFEERQTMYCGRGNALFNRASHEIKPADLDASSFAVCGYTSQLPPEVFEPKSIGATTQNSEAQLFLLLSGEFFGHLPDHLAQQWVDAGELWPVKPESLSYSARFSVVCRQSAAQDLTVRTFIRELVDGTASATADRTD